jgi:hypothetical protein
MKINDSIRNRGKNLSFLEYPKHPNFFSFLNFPEELNYILT